MQQIDVQQLVDGIKEDIKESGYTEDTLTRNVRDDRTEIRVDPFDADELNNSIDFLRKSSVFCERPAESGLKGRIKSKVLRMMMGLMKPVTADQERYDLISRRCIEQLTSAYLDQKKQLDEYKDRTRVLERKVSLLSDRLQEQEYLNSKL